MTPAMPARRARDPLSARVDALGELLGLSRTRISPDALAESGELLEQVGERRRFSPHHTVVALAGATGSGKSTLFNTLAGGALSQVGVRRPTTAAPVACVWDPDGAAALLDRLGIAPQHRHVRPAAPVAPAHSASGAGRHSRDPGGLVLLDLPDHDSAASGHREQVERLLRLVDVVVWVLDPEKYADAALHERYLRPLAGHADVMLLVLNQVDRLPGEAADQVLDDLRRLLDEDGLAVGEHGEAGAVVLAVSALTGEGVPDLRAVLGQLVAERGAADRRLAADMDRTAGRLRPLYVGEGAAGLTGAVREEFVERLADAVGAEAAGRAAERDWARAAREACGSPWGRLRRVRQARRQAQWYTGGWTLGHTSGGTPGRAGGSTHGEEKWSGSLRSVASSPVASRPVASRPMVDEAVRTVAADAARGLPIPWARAVRTAARRGGEGLPEALDAAVALARPGAPERPGWWTVAGVAQWLLAMLVAAGTVCLGGVAAGSFGLPWWLPPALVTAGAAGGPVLSWACRAAARGPARRHGQAAERRLRDAVADCGRARVLEPIAAELLRYREVREQYAVVAGD